MILVDSFFKDWEVSKCPLFAIKASLFYILRENFLIHNGYCNQYAQTNTSSLPELTGSTFLIFEVLNSLWLVKPLSSSSVKFLTRFFFFLQQIILLCEKATWRVCVHLIYDLGLSIIIRLDNFDAKARRFYWDFKAI